MDDHHHVDDVPSWLLEVSWSLGDWSAASYGTGYLPRDNWHWMSLGAALS